MAIEKSKIQALINKVTGNKGKEQDSNTKEVSSKSINIFNGKTQDVNTQKGVTNIFDTKNTKNNIFANLNKPNRRQ